MSRCGWSGPAAARNPPPMLQFMRSKKTDGLVLTSSMSVSNRKGIAVTEMPLEKITVPTLVVAHRQDGCSKTPPEGAAQIKTGLSQVPRVEMAHFEGGREPFIAGPGSSTQRTPCGRCSNHDGAAGKRLSAMHRGAMPARPVARQRSADGGAENRWRRAAHRCAFLFCIKRNRRHHRM